MSCPPIVQFRVNVASRGGDAPVRSAMSIPRQRPAWLRIRCRSSSAETLHLADLRRYSTLNDRSHASGSGNLLESLLFAAGCRPQGPLGRRRRQAEPLNPLPDRGDQVRRRGDCWRLTTACSDCPSTRDATSSHSCGPLKCRRWPPWGCFVGMESPQRMGTGISSPLKKGTGSERNHADGFGSGFLRGARPLFQRDPLLL